DDVAENSIVAGRCGGASLGPDDGFNPLLFSLLSSWLDDGRDLDAASDYVCSFSRRAVVGKLVSRRGTGWRRLCCTANVQRERRKELSRRDAVVQHSALCAALLAVDRHRTGGGGGLFTAWRVAAQRRVRCQS